MRRLRRSSALLLWNRRSNCREFVFTPIPVQQAYLKTSHPVSLDHFGYPVALAGNTLAVGARSACGAAVCSSRLRSGSRGSHRGGAGCARPARGLRRGGNPAARPAPAATTARRATVRCRRRGGMAARSRTRPAARWSAQTQRFLAASRWRRLRVGPCLAWRVAAATRPDPDSRTLRPSSGRRRWPAPTARRCRLARRQCRAARPKCWPAPTHRVGSRTRT
ncbi:MAG: hypothetical protein EXR79_14855 [Myxococcales bacterium]|nr:hypothetical protein [Myxococcales bacterium]